MAAPEGADGPAEAGGARTVSTGHPSLLKLGGGSHTTALTRRRSCARRRDGGACSRPLEPHHAGVESAAFSCATAARPLARACLPQRAANSSGRPAPGCRRRAEGPRGAAPSQPRQVPPSPDRRPASAWPGRHQLGFGWAAWLGLLWVFLAGCGGLRVTIDADPSAPLATYRSYAWLDSPPSGNPYLDDNALLEARIHRAVDRELQHKDFVLAPIEAADFTIHYHVILDKRSTMITRQDYEVYGQTPVLRTDYTEQVEYTEGTLILDVHDRKSRRLVWRGVAREAVDRLLHRPEQRQRAIDRAAKRLLRDFPPAG
ncbi:MAG: DUF4136 domain-containing protein [Myxococcales bacterium FL481]|nr:MAG: DUF4136 domain-containing protein [Myxococcales bacterium FL481]